MKPLLINMLQMNYHAYNNIHWTTPFGSVCKKDSLLNRSGETLHPHVLMVLHLGLLSHQTHFSKLHGSCFFQSLNEDMFPFIINYSKHLFSLITPLRKGPSCRARTSTCGLITAIGLTCPCTKELTYVLLFSVLAAHEPSSNMTIYVSS